MEYCRFFILQVSVHQFLSLTEYNTLLALDYLWKTIKAILVRSTVIPQYSVPWNSDFPRYSDFMLLTNFLFTELNITWNSDFPRYSDFLPADGRSQNIGEWLYLVGPQISLSWSFWITLYIFLLGFLGRWLHRLVSLPFQNFMAICRPKQAWLEMGWWYLCKIYLWKRPMQCCWLWI